MASSSVRTSTPRQHTITYPKGHDVVPDSSKISKREEATIAVAEESLGLSSSIGASKSAYGTSSSGRFPSKYLCVEIAEQSTPSGGHDTTQEIVKNATSRRVLDSTGSARLYM